MRVGINLAILVFIIVAFAHLKRLVDETNVIVGDWNVPMWVSMVGVAVPLTLAWMLWKDR